MVNRTFIGIANFRPYLNDPQFPKKELFLFDKVVLLELRELLEGMKLSGLEYRLRQAAELEWMLDAGLVVEHDFAKHQRIEEVDLELELAAEEQERMLRPLQEYLGTVDPSYTGGTLPDGLVDISLFWKSTERLSRAAAIQWNASRTAEALPILTTEQLDCSYRQGLTTCNVVQVLLENVPIPQDSLPLGDFLSFRNEPETREQLIGLRRWMRKASEGATNEVELAEEIEWLLSQYRKYMKLSGVKYTASTFEATMKLAASVAQNLPLFRFQEIAKTYFSLRRSKAELLEAELKAPGRELAYLVRVGSRFNSQP